MTSTVYKEVANAHSSGGAGTQRVTSHDDGTFHGEGALITSEDDSAATITYTQTAGFWDSFVCWASGEGRYVEPVYRHVPDNAYGGHYVMASPGGCAIF